MTKNLTIEDWWNDVLKKHSGYMGAGYDLIDHLNKTIENCGEEERKEITDFLTQKATKKDDDFAIALEVLANYCPQNNLELLITKAKTIDFSNQDIIYYLRVIGKQGERKHTELLEKFLLGPILNANHSFVHWSTYPKFPNLFSKSYAKYLIQTDYKEWTGTAIVQAFMNEPDALHPLRELLEKENPKVWKRLRRDLKKELSKDLWNQEQKKKIKI
jgi:hypothetical protein